MNNHIMLMMAWLCVVSVTHGSRSQCLKIVTEDADSTSLYQRCVHAAHEQGIELTATTAFLIRFDSGNSCIACVYRNVKRDSCVIRKLMQRGCQSVIRVRAIGVWRARDFKLASRRTVAENELLIPDVNYEGYRNLHKNTCQSMQITLFANESYDCVLPDTTPDCR